MVKRTLSNGIILNSPPYTRQEKLEIATKINGSVVGMASSRPGSADQPSRTEEPQPEEKPARPSNKAPQTPR